MKTNTLLILISLLLLLSACVSPAYLPSRHEVETATHGSFIEVYQKNGRSMEGELLAVYEESIIVLAETYNAKKRRIPVFVTISDIRQYSLRYARPVHYGGFIPLAAILPFINGVFFIFTFPLHMMVTIPVTITGETDYKYTNKTLTYGELKMFARFPQGIPPNVELNAIQ